MAASGFEIGAFAFSGFVDMHAVRTGCHALGLDIDEQAVIALRDYHFAILRLIGTDQRGARDIAANFAWRNAFLTAAGNRERQQDQAG